MTWSNSNLKLLWRTNFKVLLVDQLTASFFSQHKTVIQGDDIISSTDALMLYKVKILEDNNLEGDPKSPCTNYKINGEYEKCYESEIVREMFNYFNCTPPWMTENKELWCKGSNVTWNNGNRSPQKVLIPTTTPGRLIHYLRPCPDV